MQKKLSNIVYRENGQGMTEYIIIVALIAIAAISVITIFGQNLRMLFANSANALGGNEKSTFSTGQSTGTAKRRSLANFGYSQQGSY